MPVAQYVAGRHPGKAAMSRDPAVTETETLDLTLVVEAGDRRSQEAAELIRRLTAELAERYDFLDDGTGNFTPEDALVAGAAFLIGRVGPRPVACGAFKPLGPGVAEVKRVFVVPEHRGHGYGKRLLAELERH